MSEHAIHVSWERGEKPFDYEHYPREHGWELEGGAQIRASAAPEYRGDPALLNPEVALVGALASCHMLTFLALAARKRWTVEDYRDHAVGVLEKNARGQLAITRVRLRPVVRFAGTPPSAEEQRRLHEGAHRGCFIANSVQTTIEVEPEGLGAEGL